MSFYELFGTGTFDLANTGIQLTPAGTGYRVAPARGRPTAPSARTSG